MPRSRPTCRTWASATLPSLGPVDPVPRGGKWSTEKRSAPRSNGAPDAKAASTTSNAVTDGTAPNSPPSKGPEPGADTGSSPTTWSRSEPWRHDTQPSPPAVQTQAGKPHLSHPDHQPFFRSK